MTVRYVGILEKEPQSLWGIWFPDLPGCTTAGETSDAALDRAPEALRLWIEDARAEREALPPPRSVEELRELHDVRAALAAGHAAVIVQTTDAAMAGA